jgi:hypothetical protein
MFLLAHGAVRAPPLAVDLEISPLAPVRHTAPTDDIRVKEPVQDLTERPDQFCHGKNAVFHSDCLGNYSRKSVPYNSAELPLFSPCLDVVTVVSAPGRQHQG